MTPTPPRRDAEPGVEPEVVALVERIVGASELTLVWTNPLAGRTFRVRVGEEVHYLKISPPAVPETHDVALEAERLHWVGARLPVPEVVDVGRSEAFTWVRTRELPGIPASDPRWRQDPRRTARVLGEATRWFHDTLADAVTTCPFSWRIEDRLRRGRFPDVTRRKAAEAPPEIDLVVAHGDLCAPNILLTEGGDVSGFLDLGTLGVADRAVDLASQLWSLEFNGLVDRTEDFLGAYGYDGDVEKVRWYRDLYTTW